MALNDSTKGEGVDLLQEILSSLNTLKEQQSRLAVAVEAINGRVNAIADTQHARYAVFHDATHASPQIVPTSSKPAPSGHVSRTSAGSTDASGKSLNASSDSAISSSPRKGSLTSKITLTSYPGQVGVDPIPMIWGETDPLKRGRRYLINQQQWQRPANTESIL